MKSIVVFTGAGISAESGLGTFRDSAGLWEQYKIEDVATPEAFKKNPQLVLNFYNLRREQVLKSKPNQGHIALNKLTKKFNLDIITQNIDDLHERSGSNNVIHLHGNILEAKSTSDNNQIYPIKGAVLNIGELCNEGYQLRPNVVWFGESVPNMLKAIEKAKDADIFIIIGTSLTVYPAASLLEYTKEECEKYYIDPNAELNNKKITSIKKHATKGVELLVNQLLKS
ncbi:MAG: Sir2 family NAD-dependent protein deacetylase [Bacteroidota bacterium]|nr:Sir2 family NAD-dependent protein deacetylase [Bacteroidota bacterium]